nr:carboxypeptidase-like regulatory domain-containing protein [uncultured Fluviicola sp.]
MRTVVALLMILIVVSCTKFGKNVTLKGRVVNPITGEGIEGAEVKLLKIAGGYDSNYKTIKSATTDASGSFELDKYTWTKPVARCEVGDLYRLGWTQDGGQTFIDNFELEVKKGKVMHADFYAVPYGNLILNIKNTSCFNSSDNIKLYFDSGPYDSRTFNPGLITELNGCIDIPGSPVESSMGYKYFRWIVTKNTITTTYYDTVFVNEGTTTILDINY